MENAESRLQALQDYWQAAFDQLVNQANVQLRRIGRDMNELEERVEWLTNEVEAHRRMMEVIDNGKT